MKLATCLVATALILPGLAVAQTRNPAPAPGQSEYAPGHRAKGPGDAKTSHRASGCRRRT